MALPSLIVLDGITNALTLHDLDPLSNRDVSDFDRRVIRPMLSLTAATAAAAGMRGSGAAVVLLDHVTKAREDRGRYQIGAVHKLNRLNGAAYGLKAVDPIRPGRQGRSTVMISKDRPGRLKVHAAPKPDADGLLTFADLVVTSEGTDPGSPVTVMVAARTGSDASPKPSAEDHREAIDAVRRSRLMADISNLLAPSQTDPARAMSGRKVGDTLRAAGGRLTTSALGAALAGLEADGYITPTTHRLLRRFYVVTEDDDEAEDADEADSRGSS